MSKLSKFMGTGQSDNKLSKPGRTPKEQAILDRLLEVQASANKVGLSSKIERDAWTHILFACATIDDRMSDSEEDVLLGMLMKKKGFDKEQEVLEVMKESQALHETLGSKGVIDQHAQLVDAENKEMLFCLVAEVILADGYLQEEEIEILNYIGKKLKVHAGTRKKIMDVMKMKNKSNKLTMWEK